MYEYKAKIIKVVDGDTVDVIIDCGFSMFTQQRVRLLGINTPETRTKDLEEKKRGLAAKQRLKELVKLGKNNCTIHTALDKKGKFGRLLGVIYNKEIDSRAFNDILVAEGHAVPYYGGAR
jgi:micrococcal nuclease